MVFGRTYNALLINGTQLSLRPPTIAEFDRLPPPDPEVRQFRTIGGGGGEFADMDTGEGMMDCLIDGDTRSWGIEVNGTLVGAAGVDLDSDSSHPGYFIYVLDTDSRRQGIGVAVTTLIAFDTFTNGYRALASGCHPDNPASHFMHLKAGFIQTQWGRDPDNLISGSHNAYLLPSPTGKPDELDWVQTIHAREMYIGRLTTLRITRS